MIARESQVDALQARISSQLEGAKAALEDEFNNLMAELGNQLSEADETLDRATNSKLIPLDLAVAELYRFRDEIIEDYVPTWGQLATNALQQKIDLWMHGMAALFNAAARFELSGVRDVFREWLVITSPKG